jgi:hypothetical protein
MTSSYEAAGLTIHEILKKCWQKIIYMLLGRFQQLSIKEENGMVHFNFI